MTLKVTRTHVWMHARTQNPQKGRRGGRVSESRNADFRDGSTISLFVLFMAREVKVWKVGIFVQGSSVDKHFGKVICPLLVWMTHHMQEKTPLPAFLRFLSSSTTVAVLKCTSHPHSSQRLHPRFPMNLCILCSNARPESSCLELKELGGLQHGIPASSGCLFAWRKWEGWERRRTSGSHELAEKERSFPDPRIPSFFLLLPKPLSPCKERASSREPRFISKVSKDKLTNFKVFLNPLQSRCTYGVSQPHRQKLIELENHSGKTAKKKKQKKTPHPHHSHSGELHNLWLWKRKLAKVHYALEQRGI